MCGICGFAGFTPEDGLLERMVEKLHHRGPDDAGALQKDTFGMGMRRLSIIDVSGGKQPIYNEDRSLAIILNGEIYNYQSIQQDLIRRGHTFTSRSDTETVLHLYEEKGAGCLEDLRGMFAIAILNLHTGEYFIARDRLGKKPLYYRNEDGRFLFSSEIKSILEAGFVTPEPVFSAIDRYLALRYVPGEQTMFKGIFSLPAGSFMTWRAGEIRIETYWKPFFNDGPYRSDREYEEEFEELFTEAVRYRMISEVPLGAFLSGGVDSTAVVSTMSQLVEKPVQTFTVGFDWGGDELEDARQNARRLGCDAHEIICKETDFELLPAAIWHLDQPLGDAIIIPMLLLARLARQYVTVVLTGDGADETLAGYFPLRLMRFANLYRRMMPGALHRHLVLPAAGMVPAAWMNTVFSYPAALGNRGRQKAVDYLSLVGENDPQQEYHFLMTLFDHKDKEILYTPAMADGFREWVDTLGCPPGAQNAPFLDRIQAFQYSHWLPDDILMKQDKLSMAYSIEARVPFLDHKLVEFLFRVPPHLKIKGLVDKYLLRNLLNQKLPNGTANRTKKPFYIPLEQYLCCGRLKELIDDCLNEKRVRQRGLFSWPEVKRLKDSVYHGDFLYGKQVFSLLSLELWFRIFIDREQGLLN